MRGAGMGNSKAPVFAAAVKLARKPQIISLYWSYSATPLALGVRTGARKKFDSGLLGIAQHASTAAVEL